MRVTLANGRCFRHGYPQIFVTDEGKSLILKIIRIKNEDFVQCLKSDAIEAVYGMSFEEVLKRNPKMAGDPSVTHFTWPYARYKKRLEETWAWIGELGCDKV